MPDPGAWAAALRLAERGIDQQLRAFADERAAAERLVRLGVAAVAGSLAVAGLIQQAAPPVPGGLAAGFGFGVVFQLLALGGASLDEGGRQTTVGPDPGAVYAGISEDWNEQALLAATLEEMAAAHRRNTDALRRQSVRTRHWTSMLLLGSTLVLVASFLIVGGAILA